MTDCASASLTVAELHAVLAEHLAAGGGADKVLVEGPLTLFEVSGVQAEPGRVWLATSWCHTQPKVRPSGGTLL